MQARSTLVAVATALLIVAAGADPARAQDAMFSFADGESPAQLVVPQPAPAATARADVTIDNERNVDTTADVAIDPLKPAADPAAVYAEEAIKLRRDKSYTLELIFNSGSSATPPGTYMTKLVVRGRNAARHTVIRKDVVVNVLVRKDGPDVPVTVDRDTPLSDDFDEEVVVTALLPNRSGSGTLTNEDGDTIEVTAKTSPDPASGTSVVQLRGDGIRSGRFAGRVALGDLGAIDVALRVEDSFAWLLFALLIGVALALAAERLVRGGRLEVRRHVSKALAAAESAGRALPSQLEGYLQDVQKGKRPAGPRALAAQQRVVAAIEQLRRALERAEAGDRGLPPFKSKGVAGLAGDLEDQPLPPRFLRPADVAAGNATPDELERQHRAIARAVAVAEAWPRIRRQLWDLSEFVTNAREKEHGGKRVEAIAARLDVLLLRLRQAESADEVDPDELAADLSRLQDELALTAAGAPVVAGDDRPLPVPAPAASQALVIAEPRGASTELLPPAVQEQRRKRVLSLVTTIVVVVLGLLVLYLEDPFVSAEEYLAGLVWGLVGKIALDGVLTVFDNLATGRLRAQDAP